MSNEWTPDSWLKKRVQQIPEYSKPEELNKVKSELHDYPPLVTLDEVLKLKLQLARVSDGKAFLLQGGDCAESFSDFKSSSIKATLKVLLQMAGIFTFVGGRPVVRIGRFAGQYAKPRSSDLECRSEIKLPSYRGDIFNSYDFTAASREPDPQRILQAYFHSAGTLNFLRAHSSAKYADLPELLRWTIELIDESETPELYDDIRRKCLKSLELIPSKEQQNNSPHTKNLDFFSSHEALNLHYEEALTHFDPTHRQNFCSSAHFLWLGNRTRQLDGAHLEYLRGVANPIGIKCGPKMTTEDLRSLLEQLNPGNEPGKIVLISRMGRGAVEPNLKPLIQVVKDCKSQVVWCCDPMHGNTFSTDDGQKTRSFDDIKSEIEDFFEVCKSMQVYPGGIHLEMTGKRVTECLGGSQTVNLKEKYESFCDPRLNGIQAVELAFKISDLLKSVKA